ncbi:HAMP domain-containing protein [Undibacterium sp.]|uniref:HAMP domain-containing protein n=1 Tax=Undibacterium sp. TaxID=1914977 RepID=UPI00374DF0BB
MTIRLRITLLVLLTVIALCSIGGYAVFQSRGSAVEVKTVTEGVVPSTLASSDLVAQLKDVQLTAMSIVSEPDNDLARQNSDKLNTKKATLEKALDLQLKQASSTAQRGLVEQAKESLDNYFGAIDTTVKYKLDGKNDIAQASFFGNVVQFQVELEQIVETLRIEKNRSKDEAITALNANLATTTTAISIVTAIAVILLSIIGYLLYRQITGPISRMQQMMSEIASSQDFTRRVPVDRMDEVGRSITAFNGMIEKIQQASSQLKQKTADMQTMLQNIPQGILTVIDGNKIHPEYSAYLETVFDTKDIAGRDVMDLVFANTNLGADALSQTEAVGGACIGEDLMNFEFNEYLMVGEIEKTMADGSIKILDLSWSPITDDADTIIRLMLCVRDVTELRQLAAEANEQKHELEIIGEILAVSQEKFHEFITGSLSFLEENEQIVQQNTQATEFAVAKLFRNMHTIKGNSRTYGLLHLANIVHDAEQRYEELRSPHTEQSWDQQALLEELAAVRATVERYARINEVTLGRQGAGRRGGVERYLMIDKKHIQDSLHRLETVNPANLHELLAARDAVRTTLRLLGTEPVAEMLAGVLDSVPALAEELGKAVPSIDIDDGGYVLHTQAGSLLKNVFMHLIRNSVDHGLETPHARVAMDKPEAGKIQLEMDVAEGVLHIALSDDGRGLALGRIRQIAVSKEIIAEGEAVTDEAIARLILLPGFSTTETVTDVSGRGVGMDAVLDFVTREKGDIDIVFTDDAVGADFRQFKTVVMLPENLAVKTDGTSASTGYHYHDAEVHAADASTVTASADPRVA